VAVLSIALALALSPAGATVGRWIKHALGIPHAAPGLFSLPAHGRVLVSGQGGTWTVAADGSARRLGSWRQASWSPHGLYVVAVGANRLEAVDPRGMPRWSLTRPAVSGARWYPPTGFRIAYFSRHDLRVVAGDGTGDHLLTSGAAPVAPAWRPGHPYELSYEDAAGRLVLRDADTGAVSWTAVPPAGVQDLAWSADGTRLVVLTRSRALLYNAAGRLIATIASSPDAPILDGALSPDGRSLALVRGGSDNDVVLANLASRRPPLRRILSGSGLRQLGWSPDGRWLLVSWPPADQWVFVRVAGKPRIVAVSRIARQFAAGSPAGGSPHIEGWCCTPDGGSG
jgi:Tol biopolymer transport system component